MGFLIGTSAAPGFAQQPGDAGKITEPPEKSFPGIKVPEESKLQADWAGKWKGTWNNVLDTTLAIEKIDGSTVAAPPRQPIP